MSNILSTIKEKFSLSQIVKGGTLATYNIYSSSFYKVDVNSNKENKFTPLVGSKKNHNSYEKLSFLSNADFSFDTIEISKNIPDEEIEDAIYNIIYEELDNSLDYNIMFDEVTPPEDEKSEYRKFNIFVIDPNIIRYISSTISRTIKYIDKIYPLPILFKSLYKFSEILDRTECFIYTYRDGTSLNLFVNGELIYSKSLAFSTILFFETFQSIYEERNEDKIFYTDFKLIVTQEAKFHENKKYKAVLTKSLKVLFDEVDDVINYIKRNFNIDRIDNIYYYSKIGKILGVSEYSKTMIGEHSFDGFLSEFSISFPKELDEIHYLLYLTHQLNNDKYIYIETLKAPPSFFLRPSGHLLLIIVGATTVSLAYPLFNYYQTSQIDSILEKNIEKNRNLKSRQLERKRVLEKLTSETDKLILKEKNYQKKYQDKLELINSVNDQRTKYTMKGEELVRITKRLNNHYVSISSIEFVKEEKEHYFKIGLTAQDEESVTSLLRDLIKDYSIHIESIAKNSVNDRYRSELKIMYKN